MSTKSNLRWGLAALACAAIPAGSAAAVTPASPEQRVAAAVEKTLQKHGPEVHRCFEQALADRLDVAGKVEIEVDVGAGGGVKKAKIAAQAKEIPAAMAECLQQSALGWSIEGVEAGASVVLPFTFEGQVNQFMVKAADAPERGPAAPKSKPRPGAPEGPPKQPPPFTVKILADPVNTRARQLSLTLLTVGPASRVAMQRHPRSAKALYLVKGHARILGPGGAAAIKIDEGAAMFIPAGYPHAIENMGRQQPAVFLQVFVPPGPERVYRDPGDQAARADFEVIRDPAKAVAPPGAVPVVVDMKSAEKLSAFGGKGTVHILLDQKATGSPALALSVLELQPGLEIPRHSHAGASEALYALSGGGELSVGSETMTFGPETALHIPADQPHAGKFPRTPDAVPTVMVQIYAPAGPEQRFRNTTASK
jgi:quercetin dioxygenase-like cupin family protein